MPIYMDESGSLPAGAMVIAAVDIEADAADALLKRFKAVTGLHGELKGSRISIIERAFFFELLDRFGGRARICMLEDDRAQPGGRPDDFDVYVALLNQLVGEWLAEGGDCVSFVIDTGRYHDLMLEEMRRDVARLLESCGSARLVHSHHSPGVQIADVVANSFFNLAIGSNRAGRIHEIVAPFLETGMLRSGRLRTVPPPKQKHPALQGNAGRPKSRNPASQPS